MRVLDNVFQQSSPKMKSRFAIAVKVLFVVDSKLTFPEAPPLKVFVHRKSIQGKELPS